MARMQTISGEVITITETKPTTLNRHWFTVAGSSQGIVDYLCENGIPEHKVKGMHTDGTTWWILFHK